MWPQNVANTVLSNDSCTEGLELMLMVYEQMLEVFQYMDTQLFIHLWVAQYTTSPRGKCIQSNNQYIIQQ